MLKMMPSKLLLGLACLAPSVLLAEINIQNWQTNNGARVYFVESHDLPIVDIRVVFDAGAARDADKQGIGAMTNALMTTGSKNYSEDQLAITFEDQGAVFSNSARRDMSVFSLRSLSHVDNLNPSLDAVSDILLNPTFATEAFERDRKRALIGLKAEAQDPGTIANKKFMQALYQTHPYAHSPSGTKDSLNALTQADLLAFHQKYFVGNNAVVVIVGDMSVLGAKNLANKIIGKLPAGQKAPALAKVQLLGKADIIDTEFPSSQTHIFIGQPGIKRGDADYFTLYVGNHILGGSGLISKISEEIREKRGLAYSAYSYFSPMRESGPFTIGLQTKNESKTESLNVLRTILGDFIKNGPSADDLKHAKQNIIGGFPLRLDSNKKQAEYVAMIGFYELPLDYLSAFSAKVEAVSLKDIKDAWRRRIIPENMITVTVGGETAS